MSDSLTQVTFPSALPFLFLALLTLLIRVLVVFMAVLLLLLVFLAIVPRLGPVVG